MRIVWVESRLTAVSCAPIGWYPVGGGSPWDKVELLKDYSVMAQLNADGGEVLIVNGAKSGSKPFRVSGGTSCRSTSTD